MIIATMIMQIAVVDDEDLDGEKEIDGSLDGACDRFIDGDVDIKSILVGDDDGVPVGGFVSVVDGFPVTVPVIHDAES